MTITTEGDADNSNDTATADVTITGSDPDVMVLALDVTTAGSSANPTGLPTGKPVAPGAVGSLAAFIVNQGDMTAAGVKVHVGSPKQTTFAYDVDGCERSTDATVLNCVLDDVALNPLNVSGNIDFSYLLSVFPVRVAVNAKGPVSLLGGGVSAIALDRRRYTARQAETGGVLPEAFSRPTAAQVVAIDADPPTTPTGSPCSSPARPTAPAAAMVLAGRFPATRPAETKPARISTEDYRLPDPQFSPSAAPASPWLYSECCSCFPPHAAA